MASWTIPVREKFWLKTDRKIILLSTFVEKVSCNVKMVTSLDSLAWTYLEFPLAWHDFSISARYVNSSVKATFVMCVSNCSTKRYISTNRAVVRPLISWISSTRPSEWMSCEPAVLVQKSVLLLNSIPRFLGCSCLKNLQSVFPEVGVSWNKLLVSCVFPGVGITEHDDIVASLERIWIEGNWLDDDFRVFCLGLKSRGSVIVPLRKLFNFGNFLLQSSLLRSETKSSVNPDVFGNNSASLFETFCKLKGWFSCGTDLFHGSRISSSKILVI